MAIFVARPVIRGAAAGCATCCCCCFARLFAAFLLCVNSEQGGVVCTPQHIKLMAISFLVGLEQRLTVSVRSNCTWIHCLRFFICNFYCVHFNCGLQVVRVVSVARRVARRTTDATERFNRGQDKFACGTTKPARQASRLASYARRTHACDKDNTASRSGSFRSAQARWIVVSHIAIYNPCE